MHSTPPSIRFCLKTLICTASLSLACSAFSHPGTHPARTTAAPTAEAAQTALPPAFAAALAQAKIPQSAVSVWVAPVQSPHAPRLSFHADKLSAPASTLKLVTTYAALDMLGPTYAWYTRIYTDGKVSNGHLHGNLYVQGGGDPDLTMERLWMLLRQVQLRGIRTIDGDIIIDRSTYQLPQHNAASFDDSPLRPYNAAPDALLINFKTVMLRFVPQPAAGVALVEVSPPMARLDIPASVPLSSKARSCPGTWRAGLGLNVSHPGRWTMSGSYPAACGELNWPVAYPDPEQYANKAIEGMWRSLGGQLTGTVHQGITPAGIRPIITQASPPLTEVIYDLNKFSNNVMADQVFLAIGTFGKQGQPASYEASEAVVQKWWQQHIGNPPGSLVMDNGSGLSRQARLTAHGLGMMLENAWRSPVMPELMSSLPIIGVDGTMRHSHARAFGHMKTGSLRNVSAIAGYVLGKDGRRYVLVAIVNNPNAAAARGRAFDSLIDWVARD